jgi:histidine triad (HIT) family protein
MLSHAPEGYICPFCLIIEGIENDHTLTLQRHIVTRSKHLTAFVSSHQFSIAVNVLLVPNRHIENIYELPAQLGREFFEQRRLLACALKRAFRCDGVSTRQHNEPAGYQDVWHYHEHLTARFEGDDLYGKIARREGFLALEVTRTEQAESLRKALIELRSP